MIQQLPYLLLAAAALAWILYRQLSVQPVRENRPYLLMLVLGVVGAGQIAALAGHATIPAAAYAALGAGLLSPAADRAAAQALGTTSIMLYLSIALAAQRFATLSRSRAAAAPRFRAVSF